MEPNELTDASHEGGRTSYKTLYEEAQEEITSLKSELEKNSDLISEKEKEVGELTESISDFESDKEKLEEKVDELTGVIAERDGIIRENELRRFAHAYARQEAEYGQQQHLWFYYSLLATLFLTISVAASIAAPLNGWATQIWYEQPGFYLLNAIFLSLFVYSLKQHAYFGRLRVDYANRKTLAQSYHHIIEDGQDNEIKQGFLAEVVKIFAAAPSHEKESVTIWEYLLNRKGTK